MNNYQICEEVGRGRHSKVYKGRLKKTVDYYAIKSVEKSQRNRVLNEVTMLHQLSHEHILKFFHWYETNNHLWLIEEYCTGADLLTLIKQDTAMPEETLVTFASDLLAALNFIHSKGILYCDLKPSNVLIDAHGFLKLSDFGLACHVDDVRPKKRKIGTPSYMAPELFQDGGVLSFASDLWSLGIVLLEIFTGKPPFVDETLDGLIEKIVYEDYNRPVGCSRGFLEVLEGLLEKDPLERLDWVDLPHLEFWKDRKVVYVSVQQPAFDGYKARRAAEHNSAKGKLEAKEIKDKRRREVARISAAAQNNIIREQQSDMYYNEDKKGVPRLEADAEVDFGNNAEEAPLEPEEDKKEDDTAMSPPSTRPGSATDPEQQPQPPLVRKPSSAPEKPVGFAQRTDTPPNAKAGPTTNATALRKGSSSQKKRPATQPNPDSAPPPPYPTAERVEETAPQPSSTPTSTPTPAPQAIVNQSSALIGEELGGSSATVATPVDTVVVRAGDVDSLLFHATDTHVKPIMCNTRVEKLPEVKYDASTLNFPTHSLSQVCHMETTKLEGFLTSIYKAIGGKTTIGEKQNTLCYFETLCGATGTANLFINSLLMTLFVKMVQNENYPPGVKARLCLVMGLLIRHATFINNDLAKSGIVGHLVNLIDDKSPKVTRRVVACLGELLFYIATQHQQDRAAWSVSEDTIRAFCATLSCEDEITRHYTVKTIENITGHGEPEYTAPYAHPDVIRGLLHNYHFEDIGADSTPKPRNEYLRSSSISGVARICRAHHRCLLYAWEGLGTGGLIQGLITGSNTRCLQSCLNIFNLLVSKGLLALSEARGDADAFNLLSHVDFAVPEVVSPPTSPKREKKSGGDQLRASIEGVAGEHVFKSSIMTAADSVRFFAEVKANAVSVVHALTALLEHSSIVVRAKTLLSICLLTVVDLKYLMLCCDGKLMGLLEKISKETDKHMAACFQTFCSYIGSASVLILTKLQAILVKMTTTPPAGPGSSTSGPVSQIKEMLNVVLHTLTTPCVRAAIISSELITKVASCLQLAEKLPAEKGGEVACLQQLLLITEVLSQSAEGIKQHFADCVGALLPVLAALLDSANGGTRFMSLKVFIDILVPLQESYQTGGGEREGTDALPQVVLQQLFPKLMKLLDDEEPIPLYGLKLLNSIVTENPAYIAELTKPHWVEKLFGFFELEHRNNNVHNVKLVLKIITCETFPLKRAFELGVVGKVYPSTFFF